MKKKLIYLISFFVVLAVIWMLFSWRVNKNNQKYEKTVVGKGDVYKMVNVDAEIVPDVYTDISSELPILIDWVGAKENERVEKGQELLRLNQDSLNAQVKYAELALERAELAEKNARRRWDSLKPEERESVKKTTQQARESLREIYAQAEKTSIVSPIDGVVIEQNAQVGEVASGTLMKIIDPGSLYLEASVPEVDVSKINIVDKAHISFDAYPDSIVFGKISSIDISSTTEQNNTYFKAVIDIDDRSGIKILDGMNADVDIEVEKREGVLTVSRDWVEKDDNGYYVYILNPNKNDKKNPFVKKYFEVGLLGKNNVEIVSGLSDGEEIVKIMKSDQ